MRYLLTVIGLLWAVPSAAWTEPCGTPLSDATLKEHLVAIESHISNGALEPARNQLSTVHKELLCLDRLVQPTFMAHLAQLFSMAFFFDQDDDAAMRWMRSAHVADATRSWPPLIHDAHPLRDLEQDLNPFFSGPVGYGYLSEKKATFFMNGHFSPRPTAMVETPYLVQRTNKKGGVDAAWWQDGAAFPTQHLIEGGLEVTSPKWHTPSSAMPHPRPQPSITQSAPSTLIEPVPEKTQYVNPFDAARMRRILREKSERTITGENGSNTIVRTEIVSFVPDPSAGRPVTHQHFETWLKDSPEWMAPKATADGRADTEYLTGWSGKTHPAGARKAPVVWVPYAAAVAYCESFGGTLSTSAEKREQTPKREWRTINGQPTLLHSGGKQKSPKNPKESHSDVGFRCQ